MLKSKMTLGLSALLAAAIVLPACGNKSEISVSEGVNNMKAALTDVQAAVDAGDGEKAKASADELEEAWEKFEDNVKKQSKDLYEKVETPLHAIEAGSKSDPLDKDALAKSVTDLSEVLDQIK
jgi:iron uptake system EfeUOB component EfeO/EfeM